MSTIARISPARPARRTTAPLNCLIFITDTVGFGDSQHHDHDRAALRSALLRLLTEAFAKSAPAWRLCRHKDRGDDVPTVATPTLSTTLLVDPLPPTLGKRLRLHSRETSHLLPTRLRRALHARPVQADGAGFPHVSVLHAVRVLDSGPLRRSLTATDADLVTMVSGRVVETAVRHLREPAAPYAVRRTRYRAKTVPSASWMYLAQPTSCISKPLDWEGTAPMAAQAAGGPPRVIKAALVTLAALMVSCVVGLLSWRGGANGPNAVITGGTAFTGTTAFGFAIFDFLTDATYR